MDAVTIGQWLKEHDALDKVGGYDYLVELQDSTWSQRMWNTIVISFRKNIYVGG